MHLSSLCSFYRCALLLKTTASVVLLTFIWLLIYPTAVAAQTLIQGPLPAQPHLPNEEAELADTLAKMEEKLATLHAKLVKGVQTHIEEEDLKKRQKRFEHLDTRVRQHFDRVERFLKDTGVPAAILQRHQMMVATYTTEVATLRNNLDALDVTTAATARQHKATQALQHLQTTQPRRTKPRFDPNHLPFRVPESKVRKPRETKEEFQSSLFAPQPFLLAATEWLPGLLASAQAAALSATPTPDDLAPTEDVQLTAEVKALAASTGGVLGVVGGSVARARAAHAAIPV